MSKEELRNEIEKLLEQIKKEVDLRDYYLGLEKKSVQRIEELLKSVEELNKIWK